MAQFKALAPGALVKGEIIQLVLTALGTEAGRGKDTLAQCGIADPQPGKWYSQQAWLNALWRISQAIGTAPLLKTGTLMPETAQWPPEVDTLEKALASIDVIYHACHRGEVGHFTFEKTGNRIGTMVCLTPYSEEFDRGVVVAVTKKWKPVDVNAVLVRHEDNKPCRKKGADSCTFTIRW